MWTGYIGYDITFKQTLKGEMSDVHVNVLAGMRYYIVKLRHIIFHSG